MDVCGEYEERAAVYEYEAGLPRDEAERRAADDVLAGQRYRLRWALTGVDSLSRVRSLRWLRGRLTE